ncbi:MAG: DUF1302 domain-containing protein [Pseudomonadales bacterium]
MSQPKRYVLFFGVVTAMVALAPGVQALEFDVGEMVIDLDTELSYAAQWRVQGQDKRLIEGIAKNSVDDGDRNFDTGLVSNRAAVRVEMAASYQDWSAFVRANAFYDDVYENEETDMDEAGYATYNDGRLLGGNVDLGDFPDATVDKHGSKARILDAYVQYNFDMFDQGGSVRAGRQVISWGESTFFSGVNGLQNRIDAVAARAPGAEVKEILLPTGAAYLQTSLTDSLSAELYYQYEWEQSLLPGVGSYFSTSDLTGPGAQRFVAGSFVFPKVEDQQPDDGGQWGAATRYFMDSGTELGLYFVKSHAKTPFPVIDLASGTYSNVYEDDIRTYAGSVSTLVGEASLLVDVLYSPNMAFIESTPFPSDVVRGHLFQSSVSWTDTIGQSALADQIFYIGEVVYTRNNLGDNELEGSAFGVTDDAWAYAARVILNYESVLPGLDLEVPIVFQHQVEGHASGVNQFVDNTRQFSIGVDAFYLEVWKLNVTYAAFSGGGAANSVKDRDNISLSVKYTF